MNNVSSQTTIPSSPLRHIPFFARGMALVQMKCARQAARKGDWETAMRHYRKCLRFTPENGRVWIQLGNALGQCNLPKEALIAYAKAVSVAPALPLAHFHLAMVLRGTERDAEAQAAFHSVLLLQPDNKEVREILLAEKDEREIESEIGLRALVLADQARKSPSIGILASLRRARARKAARRLDWRAAEKHYRILAKSTLSDSRIHIQLGHALNEQGRYNEAASAYRHAVAVGPLDPDAYLHLGLALRTLGHNGAAHEAFAMVLRLAPHRVSTHPYLEETQALGQLTSQASGNAVSNRGLIVPSGLTRNQRDIWMLLAAHVSHRS